MQHFLAATKQFHWSFILFRHFLSPRWKSWLWRQLSQIAKSRIEPLWMRCDCYCWVTAVLPRRTLEIIEIVLPFCAALPHFEFPNSQSSGCLNAIVCLLIIAQEFSHFERFEEFVWILVIDFHFRMPRSLLCCTTRIFLGWKEYVKCASELLISC